MKIKMILIVSLIFIFFLIGCTMDEYKNDGKEAEFIVQTGAERHEDVPDLYRIDMALPEVSESVPNGELINTEIDREFAWRYEEITEENYTGNEAYAYGWTKIYYEVSNIDGICALNIFHEVTSVYGSDYPWRIIHSYYYNEYSGEILSKEEYIEKLGYTQEDIIQNFKERYNGKYDDVPFKFNDILFYCDQDDNLQFFATYVDTHSE